MIYKFGRKPRHFDPRVPKLKGLMGRNLPSAPMKVDWTRGITSFGMMLNDKLGDCTCAAVYHARQIWTANASVENTQPDADVLKFYELACGYNPNDPSTDQGGVEQSVLTYLLNHGMPLSNGSVDKILGFVEADVKIMEEVKVTVNEFGVSYIGFQVPQSIYDQNGNILPVWDFTDPNSQILGGHAVVLCGYDLQGFTFVSWGKLYKMTWAFFENYCDESYAIIDKNWINYRGTTPLGLTLPQLESVMNALRN